MFNMISLDISFYKVYREFVVIKKERIFKTGYIKEDVPPSVVSHNNTYRFR